jgi:nucleotide-binding universal stress UspA family protein
MIHILLPTDFSVHARKAVNYAVQLFGYEEAKYFLYHICVPPPKSGGMLISIEDILLKEAKENMATELEDLKSLHGPAFRVDTFVQIGDISDYIQQVCERGRIDYIVMGTKGGSGLTGKLLGSNATGVIKHAKAPVLLVPDEYQLQSKPLDLISIASDLKKMFDPMALKTFIGHVNKSENHRIEMVYVNTIGKAEKPEIPANFYESFPSYDLNVLSVNSDKIDEGLRSYAEKKHPDLLVVYRQKHTWLDKLLHPSVSRAVALSSETPVLMLSE